MAHPELMVGPQDPDNTAELTARYGVGNSALELLEGHAANRPPELMALLALPVDDDRSQTLVFDEVEKVAEEQGFKISGKKAIDIRGTWVRERGPRERVVTITYIVPSGRDAKASLGSYEDQFPESVALYERRRDALMGINSARAAAVGDDPESGSPAEAELRKRVEELTVELAEKSSPSGPAVPYEKYDDDNVEEVKAAIDGVPEGFERELLKRNIREYEDAQERPRKGVLEATEPVELVPAGQPEPEPEPPASGD